jgi:hypothetical protein
MELSPQKKLYLEAVMMTIPVRTVITTQERQEEGLAERKRRPKRRKKLLTKRKAHQLNVEAVDMVKTMHHLHHHDDVIDPVGQDHRLLLVSVQVIKIKIYLWF